MKMQWIIWLIFWSVNVNLAQDTLFLKITFSESTPEINIPYQTKFLVEDSLQTEIQNIISQLEKSSYLEAKIDSILHRDSIFEVKINCGLAYQWATIKNKNIPETWLQKIGIKLSSTQGKKVLAKEFSQLKSNILDYAQNNGYPFAQIKLDSIQTKNRFLSGNLVINKNIFFSNGEIIIHGDSAISSQYLKQYLDLKTNETYHQKSIDDISNKLNNLPFVTNVKSPKVRFIAGKSNIHLFLKRKTLNRFDLIFGIAPNTNNFDPRKIIFSGNGQIDLYNSFKHGERLQIAFEYLEKGTQSIDISASYPYLFQLPFGGNTAFELFKKDTSYLNVTYHLGLSYDLSSHQRIETFYQNKQTNLLNIDKKSIISSKQLPNTLDVTVRSFGLKYSFELLDYKFNPRKGIDVNLSGSFGQKNILKNNLITNLIDETDPNFRYETLYNKINQSQNQYHFQTNISYFLPILKQSTIMMHVVSEGIFGDGFALENELLQLGGASSIRGFNENQFLASLYTSITLEYRWILQKNAHLFLFSDYGYLENRQQESIQINRLLGLGTGFRFETKAGIFGLSVAIGRDYAVNNSFFDFRSPKIHFGFLNLF